MYVSRARASMHRSVTDESALLTGERNECVGTHARGAECCLFVFSAVRVLGCFSSRLRIFARICVPLCARSFVRVYVCCARNKTFPNCSGSHFECWRAVEASQHPRHHFLFAMRVWMFVRICVCLCVVCICACECRCLSCVAHAYMCSCGVHQDRAVGNMGNICEPRAPRPCGTHLTPPHPRSPALAQCRVSRARDGQGEGGAPGEVLRGVGGVRGVAGAAGRERRRGPRSTALVGRGGAARQRSAKAAGATQGGGHRRIWWTRGQKMNAMY